MSGVPLFIPARRGFISLLTEAAKKLKLHYRDSTPHKSTLICWMSCFTSGRQSLEDDPVKDILYRNRRATYDELEK